MSRFKFATVIAGFALTISLAGCSNTTNENANSNAASPAARENRTPVAENTNANNRKAGPTRQEYETSKEKYEREAKDAGRKIGTGLNDGWLWVKTHYDLAAADDLRDSTINVDVDNAVVTLSGTVPTTAQKVKAESIAKSVEGVKSVKNQLKVLPGPSPNANTNTNRNKPVK